MTEAARIRVLAKELAYSSSLLGVIHRLRNRRVLTVVTFHRVLPRDHPGRVGGTPAWIVLDTVFRDCLGFFARHYAVVGLEDVLNACVGVKPLPLRPLLITFDDGWADTAEYALPLLQEARLPAAVFVVADAVGKTELWQDMLIRMWRLGRLQPRHYARLWEAAGGDDQAPASLSTSSREDFSAIWALIRRLTPLTALARLSLLQETVPAASVPEQPQMLSLAQLRYLHSAGISIGSHGLTHTPIPQAPDPNHELRCSRLVLAGMLADGSHFGLDAFAFPRGIWDRATIAAATRAGYQLLFTSEEHLNVIPVKPAFPLVLGRIHIPGPQLTSSAGRLREASLAWWLFMRPQIPAEPGIGELGERDIACA